MRGFQRGPPGDGYSGALAFYVGVFRLWGWYTFEKVGGYSRISHPPSVLTFVAYTPVLLEGKARQIRKTMGLDPEDRHGVHTEYETPERQYVILLVRYIRQTEQHCI